MGQQRSGRREGQKQRGRGRGREASLDRSGLAPKLRRRHRYKFHVSEMKVKTISLTSFPSAAMSAQAVTGKRKRVGAPKHVQFKKAATQTAVNGTAKKTQQRPKPSPESGPKAKISEKASSGEAASTSNAPDVHVQIVTGSYERVLHGICATIPRTSLSRPAKDQNGTSPDSPTTTFTDTFLFAAHASSIRCLAISPSTASKRTLATGSSDERINLYSLSTCPPSQPKTPSLPTAENAQNRSLGNLLHHDRAVTGLSFPSKAKLFSAAEDNTIAISRARDWTMLSSIRAPIPKPQGRPSGDTAGPGEIPAGVNDFAVHPSQKLMLSVGRGERCMRLWNLITGKKAGVLNFERGMLEQVGEGKFGTGEGRRVCWDEAGEVFVVGFERGAVVFGIDSVAKAVLKPDRPTKLHQMKFLQGAAEGKSVLAVSTEDGRVLFYDLSSLPEDSDAAALPSCPCIAQLGGRATGIAGRIKDFEILRAPASVPGEDSPLLVVTASSDGAVRIWSLLASELWAASEEGGKSSSPAQVGKLAGTLETGNRITCLGAFLLDGKMEGAANGAAEADVGAAEEGGSDSEEEDDEEESE